jgi:hypothetical protein
MLCGGSVASVACIGKFFTRRSEPQMDALGRLLAASKALVRRHTAFLSSVSVSGSLVNPRRALLSARAIERRRRRHAATTGTRTRTLTLTLRFVSFGFVPPAALLPFPSLPLSPPTRLLSGD